MFRILDFPLPALIALTLAAGCAVSPTADDAAVESGPALAPPGGADIRSRANLIWDDLVVNGVPTGGIRGDGRNRYGQAAATLNEYQGEFCGVRGFIYDGRHENGNLDFDGDTYYDPGTMPGPCGTARALTFYIGSATAISPTVTVATAAHVLVNGIWTLAPGASRLQVQDFGMQQQWSCMLTFDTNYAGASNVRLTRLPDAGGLRQWRLESQGNHVAACISQNPKNGRWTDTGVRYYLPFAATVTQVPYPYPTFP